MMVHEIILFLTPRMEAIALTGGVIALVGSLSVALLTKWKTEVRPRVSFRIGDKVESYEVSQKEMDRLKTILEGERKAQMRAH